MERCEQHDAQLIKMPNEDEKLLYFKKIEAQMRLPFVIIADFESLLEKITSAERDSSVSWTMQTHKHTACGFGMYTVCRDKRFYSQPKIYFGEDSAEKFIDTVQREAKLIRQYLSKKIDMIELSEEEEVNYFSATKCHICKKEFSPGDERVRDHDHLTGIFRGAAHSNCNLQYRINPERVKIPCIIHNLKNYDAHLILSAVKPRHGKITCIPNNEERYISFTIGDVTFIDSCQFMSTSLSKLASNLTEYPETEKYVEQVVSGRFDENEFNEILESLPTDLDDFADDENADVFNIREIEDYREQPYTRVDEFSDEEREMICEHMTIMKRKGVYPYEYFDCWDKFEETSLPEKKEFFSSLCDEDISDEDFQHAHHVFNTLHMQNLKEYHNFYLLCDVLLLADVFEAFRSMCEAYYNLDPCHFYTAPGLSWQAALKMTDVKLHLLTDIDQHLFVEAGIRGGVSTILHRYAKSNIPEASDFNGERPNNYLVY